MLRVGADTEHCIVCSNCGEKAYMREITMAHNGVEQKVAYETHCESIVDPEHSAALLRATNFYQRIAELVAEFKQLPEESRIIRITNPDAAGVLTDLVFYSKRPAACQVRTTITPYFTLKTFGQEYDINMTARELVSTNLVDLLEELAPLAAPYIREAKERRDMGLY